VFRDVLRAPLVQIVLQRLEVVAGA
jgi:hypothetical protein